MRGWVDREETMRLEKFIEDKSVSPDGFLIQI